MILIVFSTTVFAGGVFSDISAEDNIIDALNKSEIKTLIFSKEGETERKQASLVSGDGYFIYLPEGEWHEAGADRWAASVNEDVKIWATHYENSSDDQVRQELASQGYAAEDNEMIKQEGDIIYRVRLNEKENDT